MIPDFKIVNVLHCRDEWYLECNTRKALPVQRVRFPTIPSSRTAGFYTHVAWSPIRKIFLCGSIKISLVQGNREKSKSLRQPYGSRGQPRSLWISGYHPSRRLFLRPDQEKKHLKLQRGEPKHALPAALVYGWGLSSRHSDALPLPFALPHLSFAVLDALFFPRQRHRCLPQNRPRRDWQKAHEITQFSRAAYSERVKRFRARCDIIDVGFAVGSLGEKNEFLVSDSEYTLREFTPRG